MALFRRLSAYLAIAAFLAGCAGPPVTDRPEPGAPDAPTGAALPATAGTAPPARGQEARPETGLEALLAPFEDDALMPPLLASLPFKPGRAYAILVQLPPATAIDLSAPNRARRGLAGLISPIARARAGTDIGHAMIGWRCADGRQGLVSKTGAHDKQAQRMLLSGWGLSTLLAEFDDGRLYTLADLPPRYAALQDRGGARVAAFEIAPEGCEAMRRALADYITHPAEPVRRFTMVPDPAKMQGAGCGSFALWLAGQGGVFAGVAPALHRDVALADSYIGVGRSLPEGVRPWLPPGVSPDALDRLSPLPFLFGDWEEGADLGSLRLMDMELMLLALDRAQARAGIARPARLQPDDAAAQRTQAAADRWLGRYGRMTPVRMGKARAAVLHRR